MFTLCCWGRDDGRELPELPNKTRFEKPSSSGIQYHCDGDDARKFDKAFEDNDLEILVDLMNSEQVIDRFEEKMHPWAENPRTMGTLAGTQLAILASEEDTVATLRGGILTQATSRRDDIRKAGALPVFCEFLRSGRLDRERTAVVALSFLTTNNSDNVICLYELGGISLLLPHMQSNIVRMRVATATILRNIAVESEAYKRDLIRADIKAIVVTISPNCINDEQMLACYNIGGELIAHVPAGFSDEKVRAHLAQVLDTAPRLITIINSEGTSEDGHVVVCQSNAMEMFVDMLCMSQDPCIDHMETLLEAILNLQDLLEDNDGNGVIDEHVQAAIHAGAEDKLRNLLTAEDDDVRSSAQEVIALLVPAKHGHLRQREEACNKSMMYYGK